MKVNFNEKAGVWVSRLKVGDPFLTSRKSTKEDGVYMKVDSHSGLSNISNEYELAVNLETGQLRKFSACYMVYRVEAEVILDEYGEN